MHERIERFYRKWGKFWKDNLAISSLPTEEDPRYQTPFPKTAGQAENYRKNWGMEEPESIEGDEVWTGA